MGQVPAPSAGHLVPVSVIEPEKPPIIESVDIYKLAPNKDEVAQSTAQVVIDGDGRGGLGCLNRISASISGASAGVRLPSGGAAA